MKCLKNAGIIPQIKIKKVIRHSASLHTKIQHGIILIINCTETYILYSHNLMVINLQNAIY
jgi:hypothetical protein